MVSTSAKKLINIATFISLFFHLILIFCLHCQSFLRISGFTKICNKKITSQCITFIVPEEGWFGQPKYSTHIKTFLRCTGFCLYFLHFNFNPSTLFASRCPCVVFALTTPIASVKSRLGISAFIDLFYPIAVFLSL